MLVGFRLLAALEKHGDHHIGAHLAQRIHWNGRGQKPSTSTRPSTSLGQTSRDMRTMRAAPAPAVHSLK